MGRKIEVKIKLKKKEQLFLKKLLSSGKENVRVIKRARALELFNEKQSSVSVSKSIGLTPETCRRIAHRYNLSGLNQALYEKPRPGKKRLLNGKQSNQIIAIACSDPPKGRDRWTIELLREQAVKRKIVKSIGRESIRILLKSHDLKPWREKNVVCADVDVRIHKSDGKNIRIIRQTLKYQ